MGKVENLGLNNSQGWEKEKTKGRIITKGGEKRKPRAYVVKNKGGNSVTSPNNHPGVCIRQLRVLLPGL